MKWSWMCQYSHACVNIYITNFQLKKEINIEKGKGREAEQRNVSTAKTFLLLLSAYASE